MNASTSWDDPTAWHALLRRQEGAVSRGQLLARGWSRGAITARLAARRWQRPIPGVYVTFTGPLPLLTKLWVALLHAGPGTVLSHETAASRWQLVPHAGSGPIHVTVPHTRGARSRRGLVVHRSRTPIVPFGSPPCTSVARTVVDLCAVTQRRSEISALLGRVAQQHRSALEEVGRLAAARRTLPHRSEVLAALADVSGGAHSPLERYFLIDVERAHGLPVGTRQRSVDGAWQDVSYRDQTTTVELDGRAVHQPIGTAWRDMARDNAAAVRGEVTLRYGWQDVRERPCAVALEVATVLRARGWTGVPKPCGPSCPLNQARAGPKWA